MVTRERDHAPTDLAGASRTSINAASREEGLRAATTAAALEATERRLHTPAAPTEREPVAEVGEALDTAALQEYRKHCVTAEQKAQEDYDKSVLSLSGGALGISFAFIKDLIGPGPITTPTLLVSAWLCWGASIIATLGSFWFSQIALRTAIRQVDEGSIRGQFPGRTFSRVTITLNALGGVLFVVGVVLMAFFVANNITDIHAAAPKP